MEVKSRRDYPGINIKDIKGNTVPFIFNNGLLWPGAADYNYNVKIHPEGFFLIPLSAGTIQVQLFGQADGETHSIAAAEITAYTGMVLPYRVKRVVFGAGTTATMKIVW